MDGLAARGVRFDRAFSAAPITLTSHATILTGRYPPGHGARHNGMRMDPAVPTIADVLVRNGFATGAFVSAFPLDRRFGLAKGFQTYSDRMPRGPQGRLASERPGRVAVDEALAWLQQHRQGRFFLWVHLFEPHAPYGDPSDRRPVAARYDDEIAEADRQIARLLEALGPETASTAVVVAADHGEAFGEHGEVSHSLFVYDTTLRVPLIVAAPGVAPSVAHSTVGHVDIAATAVRMLGMPDFDSDGVALDGPLAGRDTPARELYAETFAPLLDFGWSPLRSLRSGRFKFIEAPRRELYDLERDPFEQRNLYQERRDLSNLMEQRLVTLEGNPPLQHVADVSAVAPDVRQRLASLGYVASAPRAPGESPAGLPDPKDCLGSDLARSDAPLPRACARGHAYEAGSTETLHSR